MREKDRANAESLNALIKTHSNTGAQESTAIVQKATWLLSWLEADRSVQAASETLGVDYYKLHRLVNKARSRGCEGACVPVVRYNFLLDDSDRAFLAQLATHPREIVRRHAATVLAYVDGGLTHAQNEVGYSKNVVCTLMASLVAARHEGRDWREVLAMPVGTGRAIELTLTPGEHALLDEILARNITLTDADGQAELQRARVLKALSAQRMRRGEAAAQFGLSENTISRLLTTVRHKGVAEAFMRGIFVREFIRERTSARKARERKSARRAAAVILPTADTTNTSPDASAEGPDLETGNFPVDALSDTSDAPIPTCASDTVAAPHARCALADSSADDSAAA